MGVRVLWTEMFAMAHGHCVIMEEAQHTVQNTDVRGANKIASAAEQNSAKQ